MSHIEGTGAFLAEELLKRDLFGTIERGVWHPSGGCAVPAIRRDLRASSPWVRPLAKRLLRRELRALRALGAEPGFPRLLHHGPGVIVRTWLPGRPLQRGGAPDAAWHGRALRRVCRLHRLGIAHNDLHKEPNFLVTEDGDAALLDFQLAAVFRRRGTWFRSCAREDLRHVLKHKRTYHPEALRPRERALLARRGWVARWWWRLGKPVYLFVTRRLLGWRDREGAGNRGDLRHGPGL